MADVHSQDIQIKIKRGLAANINATATKLIATEGEPHWATDDDDLYVFDGVQNQYIGGKTTVSFKSYNVTTQGLGASPDVYAAGFYEAPLADANLSNASPAITYGGANDSIAAHAFIVAAVSGITDGTDLILTVSGTSINDSGVRTTLDTEVIVSDATAASTDEYFETTKKWLGTVTFTLTSTGGVTFAFDFNYGFCKYEDWGNRDFTLTDVEAIGFAGANDSDLDIILLLHRTTGWTYSAAAFTPVSVANKIVSLVGDHGIDDQITSGSHFAWKRAGLAQAIIGSGSEGYLLLINSSVNNALEYCNLHVGVRF